MSKGNWNLIPNRYKRWVYILEIELPTITYPDGTCLKGFKIYKIGVFTGYVNSRINAILNNINDLVSVRLVRKFQVEGNVSYYGISTRKNYVVELNAHSYLEADNIKWVDLDGMLWIPDLKAISEMSGKTEWFMCTERQAISAVMNGIRYAESNPRKLFDEQVIDFRGCITKYSKGRKPNYKKIEFEKFLKTATKKELRKLDIEGKIAETLTH